MGEYCQCRSLERVSCFREKNKCSFEYVEFKLLLRHLFGNFHEALEKFSKSLSLFSQKINGWSMEMR